ncbi:hypothetical protein BDZ94DRAFT_1193143 [Collybia nuda]|uniref:Transmembrane protein 188 n=1 Tax=Collybia nuda TaxID=64659 RepID=A0A9P5Y461_9AGAR|nr:hypothetical protein BDZ94DRAFT_1193143 [Collybia nuda]
MPPRSTPPPRGSFYPPNDNATYRDLLLFEERLKTNAASLQRRKSRYQLFLVQLLLIIAFLLTEVLLPPQTSILVIPYRMALERFLPDIYTPDAPVMLHPYFASGLLLVSVTTLVLFFASGMYSEKIAYANKYVPHANRALRSFNMYLNVRKPPLRSKVYFNPLSFFFPRPDEPPLYSLSSSSTRSLSPHAPRSRSSSTSRPIPTIPPAVNPRGELIFSTRVDKTFRESYERYRAAFERKREEREGAAKGTSCIMKLAFWRKPSISANSSTGPAAVSTVRTISSSSSRGKGGSRSGTPPTTSSINGGHGRSGIMMRQRKRNDSPIRGRAATEKSRETLPSRRSEGEQDHILRPIDLANDYST